MRILAKIRIGRRIIAHVFGKDDGRFMWCEGSPANNQREAGWVFSLEANAYQSALAYAIHYAEHWGYKSVVVFHGTGEKVHWRKKEGDCLGRWDICKRKGVNRAEKSRA